MRHLPPNRPRPENNLLLCIFVADLTQGRFFPETA